MTAARHADPFAQLTAADREQGATIPTEVGGESLKNSDAFEMHPCPEREPPHRHFEHREHGPPSAVWFYRDASGAAQCAVARYNLLNEEGSPKLKGNGKQEKTFRPWRFGRRVRAGREGETPEIAGWHCQALPEPRPLYGLDRLAARPDAPVLVCEGEKGADAGERLFPGYVAVSPMNGAQAPGKTDWTALRARVVVIWPDQDEPGAAFAQKVAELLKVARAASVRIVEVPHDWPTGWDLADPWPNGTAPGRLDQLLDDAPDGSPPDLPNGFRMTTKGLFFDLPDGEEEAKPVFVASPFQVIAQTRSDVGDSWGLLIRWRDREGRLHQWPLPLRLIHRTGNEIAEELENAGLSCGSDRQAHDLLKRCIGGVRVTRLIRCVTRTGWHPGETAPVFVLPGGEAFGRDAINTILRADHASPNASYQASGNLTEWQSGIAALAVNNDRLALCLSAAFAGPLLDVIGEPSGGLHLVGDSRTGKSTLMIVAASVWGKPAADGQLRVWRGTANGLEGVAAETSDALLILDEMNQADGREVGEIVYMLGNESGKQRASRRGTPQRRQIWHTPFLSTGEITLTQKMAEVGKRITAGLEVRLINLPADAGMSMGVFQHLHGRPSARALADELKGAARQHHGIAARVFLAKLASARADDTLLLQATLEELRTSFFARHVPPDATGQVLSVASRFALIGAAGELARDFGVLPFPAGEALRAAGSCFARWLTERGGGAGSGEDAIALAQVRAFLEANGESRFTQLSSDEWDSPGLRTINRVGWRKQVPTVQGMRWEYWIMPEMWKNEVCRGLDPRRTADLLIKRDLMMGATMRHKAALVTIKGEGKLRVYRVSGAILGEDGEGINGSH